MFEFLRQWLAERGFEPGTAGLLARVAAVMLVAVLSILANLIA